jgi:hypothetical protein
MDELKTETGERKLNRVIARLMTQAASQPNFPKVSELSEN